MTFVSEDWYPSGFDGHTGENITLQPLILLFSSSSPPHKLTPEALAKADAGMGGCTIPRSLPAILPAWPGAGRDRTGSASLVFFDANGSMHNLSSMSLTLNNHLCSG